jgi:hypothetical protein
MAELLVCLAMGNTEPYVQAACVAENVLIEQDNVASAIRITDTMNMVVPTDLPAGAQINAQLKVLLSLKSGDVKGHFDVELVLVSPSEKRKSLGVRPIDLDGGISGATMSIALIIGPVEFEKPYWLDVLWGNDRKKLTSIPFMFKQVEETKAEEQ